MPLALGKLIDYVFSAKSKCDRSLCANDYFVADIQAESASEQRNKLRITAKT